MNKFKNLSTYNKLVVGFGAFLALILIIVASALLSFNSIIKNEEKMTKIDFYRAVNVKSINSHQNYIRILMMELMIEENKPKALKYNDEIVETRKKVDSLLNAIKTVETDNIILSKLNEFEKEKAEYRETQDLELKLILDNKLAEARKYATGIQLKRFFLHRDILFNIYDISLVNMQNKVEENIATRNQIFLFFSIIAVISVFIAIWFIVLFNKVIASPLKELTYAASKIANGDFNIDKLPTEDRKDEVGNLTTSFEEMVNTLKNLATVAENLAKGNLTDKVAPKSDKDAFGQSFANMVNNLRASTSEIAEGINLLGSAASEILAATSQVATGSTETATAINETTTTVEEVRLAAQLSSQKARFTAERAQNVLEISESGKNAVEKTVENMRKIQDQMNEIANTVILLSDYTQSIGGIIASVDDIADQSNLLAVNAAIEASKAGEFGKGFAVVAQEIKNLSQLSKKATVEVRKMLGDIQKATSGAVLSTEKGNKAVESGVLQSVQAGDAIQALSESIKESLDSSIQIVASSQQQEVGMDQVGIAMVNINQSVIQNSTSMRQAEDAAKNLNEFGLKLKTIVGNYQL